VLRAGLPKVLDAPEKCMALIPAIRALIPFTHHGEFDRVADDVRAACSSSKQV
jgi:hypothetical protein